MRESIKITHAALDEIEGGTIVLRGVIANDSLGHLKTDDYQREVQPVTSLKSLMEAYKRGDRVPDIEIGMRGENFTERDGCFYLQDSSYIIDGLQRVSAALIGMKKGLFITAHIGCMVHLGTTREWERDRFQTLNANRAKVSPNILLRNLRETNPSIEMLYNLCQDSSFVLAKRVAWGQRMNRGELITARTLLNIVIRLHRHLGATLNKASNQESAATNLDRFMKEVGRTTLRDNIKTFFELIDSAWGVRRIGFREMAVCIKGSFLSVLASILSDHKNFWNGDGEKRLFIASPLTRKIGQFPVEDPSVRSLVSSGSGGNRNEVLYQLMLKHINSGKRTGRLRSRTGTIVPYGDDTNEDDAGAEDQHISA